VELEEAEVIWWEVLLEILYKTECYGLERVWICIQNLVIQRTKY